ncbi:MAG: hypothetical protein ABSG46_18270 [Candidatus Binataceae bacterium]|jgi:hypothetical protein
MKLKGVCGIDHHRRDTNLRHNFTIGPLCDTYLFSKKARLYYCTRCSWNFLVCDSAVAVLDAEGKPLAGAEAARQFQTFAAGPCPVLQTLALETGISVPGLAANGKQSEAEEDNSASPWRFPFRPWRHLPGWHRKDLHWQA